MTTEHTDAHAERDRQLIAARKDHLMTELTSLPSTAPTPAPRIPRRRLRRYALAAVAVTAVTAGTLTVTSFSGGPTGTGPTAFAIEKLPDGPVRIKVIDTEASAKQMTRQLKMLGYDITIHTIPASPDLVGRWLAFGGGESPDSADAQAIEVQMRGALGTLIVPERLAAAGLGLDVGRAPHKGEQVGATGHTNKLAPDNALFCLRLSGATPQVAATKLAAAGYTVHWRVRPDVQKLGPSYTKDLKASYHDTVPPSGYITTAAMGDPITTPDAGPRDVYVTVMQHKNADYQNLVWRNYPLTQEQSGIRDYSECPSH